VGPAILAPAAARPALGRLRRRRRLRESGLARNGLTGLTYEEALGVANPSAYTRWSSIGIDAVFTLGAALFGWAALRAQLSRRRRTPPPAE
jgi:hypothetical protein